MLPGARTLGQIGICADCASVTVMPGDDIGRTDHKTFHAASYLT